MRVRVDRVRSQKPLVGRVLTVLALKNPPSRGFYVTMCALKNCPCSLSKTLIVFPVVALKNPGGGLVLIVCALKNPGEGFCCLVRSQKPGSGVCVTSLAVLVQRSQSLTLVFQVS